MIRMGADSGSSLLEMLVALAILAGATTMIVSTMATSRTARTEPIEMVSALLDEARSEAILSGAPVAVTLRSNSIEIGADRHDLGSRLTISRAGEGSATLPELAFAVLPDGTRTGGDVTLAAGTVRRALPLISRGIGT